MSEDLNVLDQHLTLAILRLRPGAYGVAMQKAIEERTGKKYSVGAIYALIALAFVLVYKCSRMVNFAVGEWRQAATGAPCLRGAVAVFDCALWSAHEAGSHTIFIGRVLAVGASEAAPLLYTGRRYGRPMLLDA